MADNLTAEMLDEPGIEIAKPGQTVTTIHPAILNTQEHANTIVGELKTIIANYNDAFKNLKMDARLGLDEGMILDRHGQPRTNIASRPGFDRYITKLIQSGKQPVVTTPLLSFTVAEAAQCWLEQVMPWGVKQIKSIVNWHKSEQGGKTKDSQNLAMMISAINYCRTGIVTRPLILLTSQEVLESQLRDEWEINRAFFSLIEITARNRSGNQVTENLENIMNMWTRGDNYLDVPSFFARRTGGKQFKDSFHRNIIRNYTNKEHTAIFLDEGDVGNGEGGVLDQIFSRKITDAHNLYDMLTHLRSPYHSLFQYSATLYPQESIRYYGIALEPKQEVSYVSWLKLNDGERIVSLHELGVQYDVPEIALIGNTASSTYSPYNNIESFIALVYKKERSGDNYKIVIRKPEEEPEDWTREELVQIASWESAAQQWEQFKTSFVPKTICKLVENAICKNFFHQPRQFTSMCLRYICSNSSNQRLLEGIRQNSQDKFIVLPFLGAPSEEGRSYMNLKELDKAVLHCYYNHGLKPFEKPILILWTGQGRRGTQCMNDCLFVDATKESSTLTAARQAGGRALGHGKDNTALAVQPKQKVLLQDFIEKGRVRKPLSVYTNSRPMSSDRKTLEIYRDTHGSRLPEIMNFFHWLDENFFRIPFLFDQIKEAYGGRTPQPKKSPKGSWTFVKMCLKQGITPPNILDVYTEEFVSKIERHQRNIFLDDKGRSLYRTLVFQRPGVINEANEFLDMGKTRDGDLGQSCVDLGYNYSPVGFRHGHNTNVFGNKMKHENENDLRWQIQVHYDFDKRNNRVVTTKFSTRLDHDQTVPAMIQWPKADTFGFHFLHQSEKQQALEDFPDAYNLDILKLGGS